MSGLLRFARNDLSGSISKQHALVDELVLDVVEAVGRKDIENLEDFFERIPDRMQRAAGNKDRGARRDRAIDAVDRHDSGAFERKIDFRLLMRMERQSAARFE